MDEATERKQRDLRLKILKVEKELAATQHSANLGTWLHAGRAGQIQKTAEKDRERLEAKLAELKSKLEEIAPQPAAPAPKQKAAAKKPATKSKAGKSAKSK